MTFSCRIEKEFCLEVENRLLGVSHHDEPPQTASVHVELCPITRLIVSDWTDDSLLFVIEGALAPMRSLWHDVQHRLHVSEGKCTRTTKNASTGS